MTTNGEKLRELIDTKAITQALLAEKAELDPKTIQRALKGNASKTSIRRIANVLGVQPEDLLARAPQATPKQPAEAVEAVSVDKDVEEFLLYLLEQEEYQRATNPHQAGHPVWFVNEDIQKDLGWGVGRINDAVELAEQYGWVLLSNEISGSAFNFRMGYMTGEGKIYADPNRRNDPKLLLRFLASQGEGDERGYQKLSVPEIEVGLSWERMRVEDAIEVLSARNQITAPAVIGSPSYIYAALTPTGRREAARR